MQREGYAQEQYQPWPVSAVGSAPCMAGLLRMSSLRTTLFAPSAPTSRSYST